jgi:hypothetical protein
MLQKPTGWKANTGHCWIVTVSCERPFAWHFTEEWFESASIQPIMRDPCFQMVVFERRVLHRKSPNVKWGHCQIDESISRQSQLFVMILSDIIEWKASTSPQMVLWHQKFQCRFSYLVDTKTVPSLPDRYIRNDKDWVVQNTFLTAKPSKRLGTADY